MYLLFQKILACVLHFNRTIWTRLCELDMEPYHQPTYTIPFIYTYSWVPVLIFFFWIASSMFLGTIFQEIGTWVTFLSPWLSEMALCCMHVLIMTAWFKHDILVSQAFPLKFSINIFLVSLNFDWDRKLLLMQRC